MTGPHKCNENCIQESRKEFGNIFKDCECNLQDILIWATKYGHLDLIIVIYEEYLKNTSYDLNYIFSQVMDQSVVYSRQDITKWIYDTIGILSDAIEWDMCVVGIGHDYLFEN